MKYSGCVYDNSYLVTLGGFVHTNTAYFLYFHIFSIPVMSKETTHGNEATSPPQSWPLELPSALNNVRMSFSDDGKSITCTACSTYDHRKGSKSGVVPCARGRIFKFDSMLDHVKHDYHKSSMARLAIDTDGAKLTADQFRNKYGRDFSKRKKATKMCDFFVFAPKKAKQTTNVVKAPLPTTNATIETSPMSLDETPRVRNVSNGLTVKRDVCGGAFSTSDRTDKAMQRGLKLSQRFYQSAHASGQIKVIEGATTVCSMFHFNCDGVNVQ